jgi:hypothetical protein
LEAFGIAVLGSQSIIDIEDDVSFACKGQSHDPVGFFGQDLEGSTMHIDEHWQGFIAFDWTIHIELVFFEARVFVGDVFDEFEAMPMETRTWVPFPDVAQAVKHPFHQGFSTASAPFFPGCCLCHFSLLQSIDWQ